MTTGRTEDQVRHRDGLRYASVARAWAVVFAVVALLFAAFPTLVGDGLTALGNTLGLRGRLATPGDSLWWVLALSLMVSVTGLAWHTAGHPSEEGPYRILLAAKVTSTAGFGWLAWRLGAPVWLLCAAGDGFVALTLWLARRSGASGGAADGFARVYRGQRPFYEVWFGKFNLGPGRAFWFRYTLLDGATREAATWAIAFDREQAIAAGKDTHPIGDLAAPPGGGARAFESGQNGLDAGHAVGRAGAIAWDLTFTPGDRRSHDHVPWAMKAFGLARTRYVTPFGDLRFSGTVTVGDQVMAVAEAPGMIGHIHGSRSGHSWAWAHCNTFEGRPDVVFEGLSARVTVGGIVSPPLSSFVVWVGERCYRFTSALGMVVARSRYGAGRWSFRAQAGGAVIEGEAVAPADDQVALVTYTDTDGSRQWCRNSKLADLRLRLTLPDEAGAAAGATRASGGAGLGAGRVLDLVARGSAAFELVDRAMPDRPVDL